MNPPVGGTGGAGGGAPQSSISTGLQTTTPQKKRKNTEHHTPDNKPHEKVQGKPHNKPHSLQTKPKIRQEGRVSQAAEHTVKKAPKNNQKTKKITSSQDLYENQKTKKMTNSQNESSELTTESKVKEGHQYTNKKIKTKINIESYITFNAKKSGKTITKWQKRVNQPKISTLFNRVKVKAELRGQNQDNIEAELNSNLTTT